MLNPAIHTSSYFQLVEPIKTSLRFPTLRALYFIQRRNYFPPISLRLRRIKVRKQQILGRDMQAQLLTKYTPQPLYNSYRVLIPTTLYQFNLRYPYIPRYSRNTRITGIFLKQCWSILKMAL